MSKWQRVLFATEHPIDDAVEALNAWARAGLVVVNPWHVGRSDLGKNQSPRGYRIYHQQSNKLILRERPSSMGWRVSEAKRIADELLARNILDWSQDEAALAEAVAAMGADGRQRINQQLAEVQQQGGA